MALNLAAALELTGERNQARILTSSLAPQADQYPDFGLVSGNVYRNGFFRFEYRIPDHWHISQSQRSARGSQSFAKPGVHPLLFAFQPLPHLATIFVRAVELPSPDVTAKQFLLNEYKQVESRGAKPQGEPKELSFGGWQFFFATFKAKVGGATMREEHLVTIQRGYALEFSFMANEEGMFKTAHKTMESIVVLSTSDRRSVP